MNNVNKDIKPLDSNGDFHGYQEWYRANNKLWLRAEAKHGRGFGYQEWHFEPFPMEGTQTKFHIK